MAVYRHEEVGAGREVSVDRPNPHAGAGSDIAHRHIDPGIDEARGRGGKQVRLRVHMTRTPRPRFGIMTAQSQVSYDDIVTLWREADAIPEIEHAWLFDHLLPIFGDRDGPIFEGWTLLSALAAHTDRLRLGLLVTSNRFRPPAILAKIATGGRSARLLRITAKHADVWNIPGGDIEDAKSRSALLDRYCDEIGRDPGSIVRSMHIPVSYDQPDATRDAIGQAIEAGFEHLVLGLSDPYRGGVARWVADELIAKPA